MRFKILNEHGETVNTIVADLDFVQANYPFFESIGDVTIVQTAVNTTISCVGFLKRFTSIERHEILITARSEVLIEDFLMLVNNATHIDLADPLTISAVNTLEQFGLIGVGRAIEILTIG
jgi:hypothetical protein